VSEPRLAGRRVLVVGAGTQPSDEVLNVGIGRGQGGLAVDGGRGLI
jgi:hypothetical protein